MSYSIRRLSRRVASTAATAISASDTATTRLAPPPTIAAASRPVVTAPGFACAPSTVDQAKQPGEEEVRRQPAGERTRRRDHAELVEAAEAGGRERRVPGSRRDRRGQRPAPGGARRDAGGFGGGRAA